MDFPVLIIWVIQGTSSLELLLKWFQACRVPRLLAEANKKILSGGFPGGAVVENLPANAGDTGSSPGLGRSHMPRSN